MMEISSKRLCVWCEDGGKMENVHFAGHRIEVSEFVTSLVDFAPHCF